MEAVGHGYGKPPWIFKGRALYQLHLVKAETARGLIPEEFRLVEAFGYTLGGFFLASYDDSPAGSFDELVVIAGIVWNPPTSCAWAARVLVSSNEACIHGRKDVGLPSRVATFSKTPGNPKARMGGFLDIFDSDTTPSSSMQVQVSEMKGNLCNITADLQQSRWWMGPNIKMSLPSFSGRTKYNSELLKYSCELRCRVRAVAPAKVLGPPDTDPDDPKSLGNKRNLSISVLLSKPILALEFTRLNMKVEAPTVASSRH